MPLSPGTQLGPYEIIGLVGSGGMGEVYRARDPRLNREVAIKISQAKFSERFEREARAIAALNHPHICQIYDVGPDYIVIELIDGSPVKGPLPLDQALNLSIQLASAIEAAHRKGIAHRDLKPANILNTKSGIKVLDFGLAKTESPRAAPDDATLTKALTQEGSIVGTLQYMAPEQLNGKEVDTRADLFAFGCVLFEILTGKRAFEGATTASVIAAILEREAPSVTGVAPAALDRLLKKCLAKDPDERWQTAHDLKDELEWIAKRGGAQQAASRTPSYKNWLGWLVAVACGLGLAAVSLLYFRQKPEMPVARFAIQPPENTVFPLILGVGVMQAGPALSPDGRKLVVRAVAKNGTAQLWLRSLDAMAPQPLAGTQDGQGPFWSPDSRSIGFFADGKLKRIDVADASKLTLSDLVGPNVSYYGSWGADGTILVSRRSPLPLLRIPAAGGSPTEASRIDPLRERAHLAPWFLPDGKSFLFASLLPNNTYTIRVGSLGSMETRPLVQATALRSHYASGHLLFVRGSTLMAQSFDPGRLATNGEPVLVAERIAAVNFSASAEGTLIYAPALTTGNSQFTWYDRQGRKSGTIGNPAIYSNPALSPDGKRLAVAIGEQLVRDIWVFDLARGVQTRLTFDPADDLNPTWSPDGSRIAFSSLRKGNRNIYWKLANGAGSDEMLLYSSESKGVEDWSPDGKFILYNVASSSVWALPVEGDRKPFPVLNAPFTELEGKLSADGHWIAYRSDESGQAEVFIQSFPPSGGKWQISSSGGRQPSWRADGKELFYLNGTKVMAVDIKISTAGVEAGTPRQLFDVPGLPMDIRRNVYLVTPDGQRFLCQTMVEESLNSSPLIVLQNWPATLKK